VKFFCKLLLFVCLIQLAPLQCEEVDYWNGEDYFHHSSSQKDAAADLLKYVSVQDDAVVLDVGCGDGKITAGLAGKVLNGRVTGIDISPSMIDFAKAEYENAKYPHLTFALGDAEEIHDVDTYDVIVALTSLQWLKSHETFLIAAMRALKPNGTLAVTMPTGLPATIQQAVDELISRPEWAPYFSNFKTGWNFVDDATYGAMLSKAGFHIERLAIVPQKDIFPSRQAFQGFISQWFPYLRPLPESIKQAFMTLVIDRFLELESPFPNGEVHFKIRRLEVQATKVE
jgi:trans-aconitate methyltransferase